MVLKIIFGHYLSKSTKGKRKFIWPHPYAARNIVPLFQPVKFLISSKYPLFFKFSWIFTCQSLSRLYGVAWSTLLSFPFLSFLVLVKYMRTQNFCLVFLFKTVFIMTQRVHAIATYIDE